MYTISYIQLEFAYLFSEDFFYRNGRVCVWECTLEPDDWVEWEPPSKKEKPKDSDSEDDIDVDKIIEKTEKQKAYAEKKLLDSGEKIFLSFYEIPEFNIVYE